MGKNLMDKAMKVRRILRGLTQTEVANELGVVRATVVSWERGNSYPTARDLPKIAGLYHCNISDLYNDSL